MKQITINSNSTSSSNLTSRPSTAFLKIATAKPIIMMLNKPINIILEQPFYSLTPPTGHCRR